MGLLKWVKSVFQKQKISEAEIHMLESQRKQEENIARLQRELEFLKKENAQIKSENKRIQQEHLKSAHASNPVYEGIELSDEQTNVLSLLENTNRNYFVTGKAGTGKSLVLRAFRKLTKKKGIVVCAYTGAAALNVNGVTIHSLFRLQFGVQNTSLKSKVQPDDMTKDLLKTVNVLIIDEISMVRSDVMDMIDAKMKFAKGNGLPFGGCQVIAFGDLFQLPPIVTDDVEKEYLNARYQTPYFFGAPAVRQSFQILELKEVHRQKDEAFIRILNEIREGNVTESDMRFLNVRGMKQRIPDDTLKVTLTRSVAKDVNQKKLAAINAPSKIYKAQIGGISPPTETDAPFEFLLELKVGARVMTIRNDPMKKYMNGSVGTVVAMSDESIDVLINNKRVTIEEAVWTKNIYKKNPETGYLEMEAVGWGKQLPIRLAYAITIHKSQGQTYDSVILDYSGKRAFAPGQTYVALSRCKTLDGLYLLKPLTRQDIYADPQVVKYMQGKPIIKETQIPVWWDARPEQEEPETQPFNSTLSYSDKPPEFTSLSEDMYPF